jgi:hypothetical protein
MWFSFLVWLCICSSKFLFGCVIIVALVLPSLALVSRFLNVALWRGPCACSFLLHVVVSWASPWVASFVLSRAHTDLPGVDLKASVAVLIQQQKAIIGQFNRQGALGVHNWLATGQLKVCMEFIRTLLAGSQFGLFLLSLSFFPFLSLSRLLRACLVFSFFLKLGQA